MDTMLYERLTDEGTPLVNRVIQGLQFLDKKDLKTFSRNVIYGARVGAINVTNVVKALSLQAEKAGLAYGEQGHEDTYQDALDEVLDILN